MLKFAFAFICGLSLIYIVPAQKYLSCTFDEGDFPCRLTPLETAPELQTMSFVTVDDPSLAPLMPLSDVTSITEPTIGNNVTCQLPYKLNGGSADIYFCSRRSSLADASTCAGPDGSEQQCLPGQYVVAQLIPSENRTYYTEVQGTSGSSCLTFYYYITRANAAQIGVWISDISGGTSQKLGTVVDVPYNGWHRTHFSFQPNVNSYHLYFDLQRSPESGSSVFIALDEIKIVNGRCDEDIIDTTTKPDQTSQTRSSTSVVSSTTTTIMEVTTQESLTSSTQSLSTTTTTTSTTTTTTITSTTTTKVPLHPIFHCDFSGPCFAPGAFSLTYGHEFETVPLTNTSEPPRAPTSDAVSVSHPTSNGRPCKLPYQPLLATDNLTTTNWDMWFCYSEACPTENGQFGGCTQENYGLISLDPTENRRTVVDSLTGGMPSVRDAAGEQCLRFYYYFTVYDGKDWGQQIILSLRRGNQSNDTVEIESLTIADMTENRWYFKDITIERNGTSDSLQVDFIVSRENRSESAETNRTINFAMDEIELYDYNCSYVREQLAPATSTTPATTTEPEATRPPKDKPDLPLILGLSLGLGSVVIIIIVGFVIYRYRAKRRFQSKSSYEYDKYFPLVSPLHKKATS